MFVCFVKYSSEVNLIYLKQLFLSKLHWLTFACFQEVWNYHIVILLSKLGSNKRVNKTQIHPSKTMRHFGAQTVWADSTLKWLHPLYFLIQFLNPDQHIFCTIWRCLLDVNKLLRNEISSCQEVFYYKTKL